jgi:hypothetical protein
VREVNPDVEIHRVLFNEITKKGVLAGLDDPRELDANLYEAQRTRRVLDRIGGYPLSSLLWKKLTFGLSAGRVQTPALRIIVDREHEREAFVPQNYWLVDAQLVGKSGVAFTANLVEVNGEKLERVGSRPAATSEPAAASYVSDLRDATYRIREITRRQSSRKAPAPYITSKLQQDASTRLGMAPKRAMSVAQQLYEGIELGKGKDAEPWVSSPTCVPTARACRMTPSRVPRVHRGYLRQADARAAEAQRVHGQEEGQRAGRSRGHSPHQHGPPPDSVAKYLKEPQLKLYRSSGTASWRPRWCRRSTTRPASTSRPRAEERLWPARCGQRAEEGRLARGLAHEPGHRRGEAADAAEAAEAAEPEAAAKTVRPWPSRARCPSWMTVRRSSWWTRLARSSRTRPPSRRRASTKPAW